MNDNQEQELDMEDIRKQLALLDVLLKEKDENSPLSHDEQRDELFEDVLEAFDGNKRQALSATLGVLAHVLAQTQSVAGVSMEAQLMSLKMTMLAALGDRETFAKGLHDLVDRMGPEAFLKSFTTQVPAENNDKSELPQANSYNTNGYL